MSKYLDLAVLGAFAGNGWKDVLRWNEYLPVSATLAGPRVKEEFRVSEYAVLFPPQVALALAWPRWMEVFRLSEYLAVAAALTGSGPLRRKEGPRASEYTLFPPHVALALAGLRVREYVVPFWPHAALAGSLCGVCLDVRGCNRINGMAPESRLGRQGRNIFSFSLCDAKLSSFIFGNDRPTPNGLNATLGGGGHMDNNMNTSFVCFGVR